MGTPPDQTLISWVRHDFGLPLAAVDRVLLGADRYAALWRGTGADGRPYAVKLSAGGSPAGLAVSAHLARHGAAGVAAPLPATDGRAWSERDGRRLSVVPWVSDRQAIGAMTAGHWAGFGALLARVHTTPVTGELAGLLPPETYTHDRAATAVATVHRVLGLGGRPGSPVASRAGPGGRVDGLDAVGREVAEVWAGGCDAVDTLLARADELGPVLRVRDTRPVVCHGDPHLGNVLLGEAGRLWLIDWDDAVLAPPELDLMLLLGGMGEFGPVTADDTARLLDGYGPADLDPDLVAYFRCRRALEDASDWAVQALEADRRGVAERADALDIVRSVLGPDGMVALALRDL